MTQDLLRHNKKVIPLPPMEVFDSKDDSPYALLHRWVAKQCGGKPEGLKIDVNATLLHPKDKAELDQIILNYIKLKTGNRDAGYRYSLHWHNMEFGPRELLDDTPTPEWLVPGFAYVDTDKLFAKEELHENPN
jgi:hypothetical protein